MISLNSSDDLQKLFLYHTFQWKTIEKSFEIYEKLCAVLGNEEAISYEEYEKWYNQYLYECCYWAKRDIKVTDIVIFVCSLSDYISGKLAENSYSDLCEAFGNDNIDKNDHAHRYNIFCSNCERPKHGSPAGLDVCVNLGLGFSDLPEDAIVEILDRCDLKSYLNLRDVSHSLRTIVDQQPPPCTNIEIISQDDHILITENNKTLVDSYRLVLEHELWFCSMDYIEKRVFRDLEALLKNPKLRLKSFQFVSSAEKDVETRNYENYFLKLLCSLAHKIHVEYCWFRVENMTDIGQILQCFKPGTLQKLEINDSFLKKEISRIAQMDQWKQAKHLNLTCFTELSMENFFHFSTFRVYFERISTNNLVSLCDNLPKSTNFESCIIKSIVPWNNEAIKNALNLQPSDTPNKYSIPNSNLEVQFSIDYSVNEISIRKL